MDKQAAKVILKTPTEWHSPERIESQPKQTSSTIALSGPIAEGWTLIQPLYVDLEQDEDGSFVMGDDVFLVYGYGNTPTAAYQDYITSLIEFYGLVADRAAEGEPVVVDQLAYYQQYLHSVSRF